MAFCAQCKWYKLAGLTENDRCEHEKSGHRIGGVREEPRIIFYTCETMLKAFCENHKLFEPKLEAA